MSRVEQIDILKTICTFLIVCIHVPFPGTGGEYFTVLTRIAVPIFFMITGYFYSDIVAEGGECKQIKKITVLLLLSNLIFLLWDLFTLILKGKRVMPFLRSTFTTKGILKFILLNESPFAGHLWYLGAILYVLLIVLLTDSLKCRKYLYCATPFLLIADLLFGKYSLVVFHREFSHIIVRNFLFVGIPYFSLGCLIRSLYDEVYVKSIERIRNKVLLLLIVLLSTTSLIERFILETIGMNATRDHYVSTTFLAIIVFIFTLHRYIQAGKMVNFPLVKVAVTIGRKYSAWLYILHPIFIQGLGAIANKIAVYSIYKYVAPMVVYFVTLIFLIFFKQLVDLVRKRKWYMMLSQGMNNR